MRSKLVIEIIVDHPGEHHSAHEELADQIGALARAKLEEAGVVWVGGAAWTSWVSKDDVIRYTPRKKHLRAKRHGHEWTCSTDHVSPRNLTDDRAAVTCLLCLAIIEQENKP